ncbi:hypothetical protein C8R43DRAFT_1132359 [Mycena crocata]|nr:hypothetical protein C8R43DRAFT_1132359 [Mycena crocata]
MSSPTIIRSRVAEAIQAIQTSSTESAGDDHATLFVGDYTYPNDMEISLLRSLSDSEGNSFIYKTSPRTVRRPFRAFVFGEIKDIECVRENRPNDTLSAGAYRVTLRCSPIATARGKNLFSNDIDILQSNATISLPWVEGGEDATEGVIFVYGDETTKHITREIEIGWPVIADASFYRQDVYVDNVVHTEYRIFAHSLEAIQKRYLQSVDVLKLDIATQRTEEVIARVQAQMEKMQME